MAEAQAKHYTARRLQQRREQLQELAQAALAASAAEQTELYITEDDSALTRFAGSSIHQNTQEQGASVTATTRLGQRQGRASTNRLTADGLQDAIAQAVAAAQVSAPNPYLDDLPAGPRQYPLQVDFFEATAACTPEERAQLASACFKMGDESAFTASGALATSARTVLIANSRGLEVCFSTTLARLSILWTGPDSTGYAERTSRDIGALDCTEAAIEALAIARRSVNPRGDVPAGHYPVVLGPYATGTLLGFLAWLAFSGKSYIEGASALSGRLGTAVCGDNITLVDDPLDPRLLAWPCDASGLPRQRLGLIESGVARGIAHDAETAKRAGGQSTAHAMEVGPPVPGSLVFSPGASDREQLIAGVERGIYVSRFHYTNTVDPQATLLTGMTRDGTFLIEHGQLAGPLTNFRFTQAVLPALSCVSGIAGEQALVGGVGGGYALVPEAVRIDDFNFSGKSDH